MMAGFGLIWILILAGVVYAGLRLLGHNGANPVVAPPSRGGGAEEILRQRFARGEIDREEYGSRLRDLRR